MKKLRPTKFSLPQSRVLFFEAILRLCGWLHEEWPKDRSFEFLRTHRRKKKRWIYTALKDKNKYRLRPLPSKLPYNESEEDLHLRKLFKFARQKLLDAIEAKEFLGALRLTWSRV